MNSVFDLIKRFNFYCLIIYAYALIMYTRVTDRILNNPIRYELNPLPIVWYRTQWHPICIQFRIILNLWLFTKLWCRQNDLPKRFGLDYRNNFYGHSINIKYYIIISTMFVYNFCMLNLFFFKLIPITITIIITS